MPFELKNEYAKDVSMSNARFTDKIKVPVRPCLFTGYHQIFAHARQIYRSCSTNVDVITRHRRGLELEETEYFTNCTDYIGNVICLEPLKVSTRPTEAVHWIMYLTTVTDLRSVLEKCNFFVDLYHISLALPRHWIGTYVKVNNRPLND